MTTITVETTISAALAQAQPGDVVEVPGGDYREGQIVIDTPITLRPVAGDKPVIHATDGSAVVIAANGVTIEGLTIDSLAL